MTILSYAQIISVLILCFLFLFRRRRCCKNPFFIDWPFLGMLLPLLFNLSHIHDFLTQALKRQGRTGNFKGPWFTNLNYLVTCDPINIQYIMTKKFRNFEKGHQFRERFDVFGDGILAADSETWKYSRAILHPLFQKKSFEVFYEKVVQNKMQTCLLPFLDHVQTQGVEVDLQDVFQRFNFDYSCSLVFGFDPQSLAIDFPKVACAKAFTEAEEFLLYRHVMPQSFWKLQRWLQVGAEKKLAAACKTFDQFVYERISSKRQESSQFNKSSETEEEEQDELLASLMKQEEGNDKFLRDTAFSLLAAGRETITSAFTWLCWLVARNPSVEAKILQEIKEQIEEKGENASMLGVNEVKNLVYLHAAICEVLRLYPPIPFNFKQAVKADILPSGHDVDPSTVILFSFYSVGRLEDIWGQDSLEFKPERWISDTGCIVNVPSHEFPSFNTGPRACLGKNLSIATLKIVATAILWNYHIQVLEDHPISPSFSLVLMMKHGLKVKITKRGVMGN